MARTSGPVIYVEYHWLSCFSVDSFSMLGPDSFIGIWTGIGQSRSSLFSMSIADFALARLT